MPRFFRDVGDRLLTISFGASAADWVPAEALKGLRHKRGNFTSCFLRNQPLEFFIEMCYIEKN
ncbi:MAG TPA: hypothetical protein DDX91_00425 [Ruminococcaceae bacterium]|nr:hypothetical protein [Oscillospiraceae bacterium]